MLNLLQSNIVYNEKSMDYDKDYWKDLFVKNYRALTDLERQRFSYNKLSDQVRELAVHFGARDTSRASSRASTNKAPRPSRPSRQSSNRSLTLNSKYEPLAELSELDEIAYQHRQTKRPSRSVRNETMRPPRARFTTPDSSRNSSRVTPK